MFSRFPTPQKPMPAFQTIRPFHLRPATDADCEFLWDLLTVTIREYVAAVGVWDDAVQEQQFWCSYDPARWWIVVVDGENAGGLALDHHPQALFWADLHILPAHQRKGIGSAILRHLIAEAQDAALPLLLQVLDSNPGARRLYERLGFSGCFPSPMLHYSVMIASS